jgi:hypothetical protein
VAAFSVSLIKLIITNRRSLGMLCNEKEQVSLQIATVPSGSVYLHVTWLLRTRHALCVRVVVKTRFLSFMESVILINITDLLINVSFGTSGPLVQLLTSPIMLLIYASTSRQTPVCFAVNVNAFFEARENMTAVWHLYVRLLDFDHCSQFVIILVVLRRSYIVGIAKECR